MSARVALVGGGVRSGKSAFALDLARRWGTRRVFLATAQALDGEMRERIKKHVRERGDVFRTVEEPLAVAQYLATLQGADVVVIDCLTLWLSNLLLAGASEGQIAEQVDELVQALGRAAFDTIVVSNEVGMGVVPESALGRTFRDIAGRTHQAIASTADEIYLATLGVVLRLRPEPLGLQPSGAPT